MTTESHEKIHKCKDQFSVHSGGEVERGSTYSDIRAFLELKTIAVAGVSRSTHKFANRIFSELLKRGYRLFPVNPNMTAYADIPCYPSLGHLPEPAEGVVIVTPPNQTFQIVQNAYTAGITKIWLQQGADSPEAIAFCREKGIQVIFGECILMFLEPRGWIHQIHYWIWKYLGKLPKENDFLFL